MKRFSFIAFFFCLILFQTLQGSDFDPSTPHFRRLLRAGGIQGPFTTQNILTATQKQWMAARSGLNGIERCDLVDTPQYQAMRPKVLRCLNRMRFFEASLPTQNHYDYAVCLGAFLPSVRDRLFQLVEAWKQGVRFDSLIFLTGERLLRKRAGEKEDQAALCDATQSPLPFRKGWKLPLEAPYEKEIDMMRLVWDQVAIPADMQKALKGHVHFIEAPKENQAARATTGDTYRYWLKTSKPSPGSVLASSSPIVHHYQHLVGRNILGPHYSLETIAPSTDSSKWQIALLLDTVAKCLYETYSHEDLER